jgi:8-oxo-dGTP pyrophosphatase MutT (NUDIX family)
VRDVSAGGVVVRAGSAGPEVALVGRGKPLRWGLPKGGIEAGETIDHAALREAREETGLEVRLLAPVGDIQYWFATRAVRHHKTVHFFLMEATGGDVQNHDWENDEAAWFPIAEALNVMAFPNEIAMVRRAWDVWRNDHAASSDTRPGNGERPATGQPG